MKMSSSILREIRAALNKAGMMCHVKSGCRLEIVCERDMKWGNAKNILETACFLIREVCGDAKIELIHWEDVGNDLYMILGLDV